MTGAKGLTRRVVLGTSASSVAAGLAACTTGGGAPAAADVQGTVVWSTRVNAEENQWQQEVILPKLREKIPKLTLSIETAPSNEWTTKLIGLYAAGTPPDIHHGFAGIIISLYAQNQALELTPLIKRDKFDLAPFGGFQNDPDMCRSGKMYGLPIDTTVGTQIFYNAAMLQQAGIPQPPTDWKDTSWTWDRVLDIARRTTKNAGEQNAVYGLTGYTYNPWFQIWPYMWGGDLWPKDFYAKGIGQVSQLTSPPVVASFQHLQDLALRHRVLPAAGAPNQPMNQGGAAMWIQSARAGMPAMQDVTFPWGLAPLPRQVTNRTVCFTNCIMANKSTKVPEGAWQVLKYLASQEGQLDRIRVTPAPPVRLDAYDPWLDSVLPQTVHKTKAELREVTSGYQASFSDPWAHFVADASSIQPHLIELQRDLLANAGTAATLLADTKTKVESQMRMIYDKLKDSPLARDTLCQ
jgi:multiple sugar transport system substrate-binding protein